MQKHSPVSGSFTQLFKLDIKFFFPPSQSSEFDCDQDMTSCQQVTQQPFRYGIHAPSLTFTPVSMLTWYRSICEFVLA